MKQSTLDKLKRRGGNSRQRRLWRRFHEHRTVKWAAERTKDWERRKREADEVIARVHALLSQI